MPRRLVLVTGAPGAGKSTLAVPLAAALEFPLLMKDTIKEAIYDALGEGLADLGWSRRVGGASYEVLWAVAAHMPDAILECNFHPDDERTRSRLLALHPRPVEVFCRCPIEEAARRYRARHAAGLRHAAHALAEVEVEDLRKFEHPLALGPVIELDTTLPVDVDHVVALVRRGLG